MGIASYRQALHLVPLTGYKSYYSTNQTPGVSTVLVYRDDEGW